MRPSYIIGNAFYWGCSPGDPTNVKIDLAELFGTKKETEKMGTITNIEDIETKTITDMHREAIKNRKQLTITLGATELDDLKIVALDRDDAVPPVVLETHPVPGVRGVSAALHSKLVTHLVTQAVSKTPPTQGLHVVGDTKAAAKFGGTQEVKPTSPAEYQRQKSVAEKKKLERDASQNIVDSILGFPFHLVPLANPPAIGSAVDAEIKARGDVYRPNFTKIDLSKEVGTWPGAGFVGVDVAKEKDQTFSVRYLGKFNDPPKDASDAKLPPASPEPAKWVGSVDARGRIRDEFALHPVNQRGRNVSDEVGRVLTRALDEIETLVGNKGREMHLARTKLEEAVQWVRRAIGSREQFTRRDTL